MNGPPRKRETKRYKAAAGLKIATANTNPYQIARPRTTSRICRFLPFLLRYLRSRQPVTKSTPCQNACRLKSKKLVRSARQAMHDVFTVGDDFSEFDRPK